MSQFDYVNNYYSLNMKRGTIVKFKIRGKEMSGSVLSADGNYIYIRGEDGKRYGPFHPTDGIEYGVESH